MFRQFAHELWGESLAVSQLWGAHQKRLRVTYENKFLESVASKAGLYNKQSFDTRGGNLFRKYFDRFCRCAFVNAMTNYQDYSQPIVSNTDLLIWMRVAERVFDPQWRFLRSLRGNSTDDSPELAEYNKRRVAAKRVASTRRGRGECVAHRRRGGVLSDWARRRRWGRRHSSRPAKTMVRP